MKIGKDIEKELNKQINAELYSGYMYLSMSAYFEEENLPGFANWMRKQAEEEKEHAMKFYNYVVERGGRVELDKIEAPPKEWNNIAGIFEEVYKHEQKVTSLIDNLVDLAREAKDNATFEMLQWFVKEQVEEEANADEVRQKVKLVKDSPQGLLMLDSKLAQRGKD